MVWSGGIEKRFSWDVTFLAEAFLISQRSFDPRTNHGACLVSKDHRILSKGYNGPIKNTNDKFNSKIMGTDDKYHIVVHAEENCILNYHGNQFDLIGSTMYITGEPCHRCLRMILQKGIRRIFHGNVGSKCVDKNDKHAKDLLTASMTGSFSVNLASEIQMNSVKDLLKRTIEYIDYKS